MVCQGFIQTTEKSSMGKDKDACLRCGRTEEAHQVEMPEVHIWFQGKMWKFKNWEAARECGFYLS